MSIKIRPYQAQDKADVIRLLVDLQDHVAHLDPWKLNRTRKDFDGKAYVDKTLKELTKQDKILVAVDGESVLGLIQTQGPDSKQKTGLEWRPKIKPGGSIKQLIVDKTARRLGVGKKLIKAAEQELKKQGCGMVFISCFVTNTQSLEFYRSQKYTDRNIQFAKRLK